MQLVLVDEGAAIFLVDLDAADDHRHRIWVEVDLSRREASTKESRQYRDGNFIEDRGEYHEAEGRIDEDERRGDYEKPSVLGREYFQAFPSIYEDLIWNIAVPRAIS